MPLSEDLLRSDSSAQVDCSPRMEDVVGHVCSGTAAATSPALGRRLQPVLPTRRESRAGQRCGSLAVGMFGRAATPLPSFD